MSSEDTTSEGKIDKGNANKRRRQARKSKARKPAEGSRMIMERWTQAILPPGSDDNPNVPGI
jgi:hypothetical protein